MDRWIGIVTLGKILAVNHRHANEAVLLQREVAGPLASAIDDLVGPLSDGDDQVVDAALVVGGALVNYEPVRTILYRAGFYDAVVEIFANPERLRAHDGAARRAAASVLRHWRRDGPRPLIDDSRAGEHGYRRLEEIMEMIFSDEVMREKVGNPKGSLS